MSRGSNTLTKLNLYIMFFNKKNTEEVKQLRKEVQALEKRILLDEQVKSDFTRVGTPIRVMTATKDGWRFNAAQISRVQGSEVDVWVFPCTGEPPYLIKNPRHLQFKKKGEPCWDFVGRDCCHSEHIIK